MATMCLRDLQIEIKTKVSRAKSKAWAAAEWSNLAQICRDPFAMAGLNMTALLWSDGRVVMCGQYMVKLNFHHWMRESCTPRFLQASAYHLLLFSEVMVVCWLAGTLIADSATFHRWTKGVHQVSAGGDHTVLLRSDGRVVACGTNHYGQCNILRLDTGGFHQQ
jgi:alpha-tubulin suppressor-like RCC1 family protein